MTGEIMFFLVLQIIKNSKGMFISQEIYLKEILKMSRMEDCSPVTTPMVFGWNLCKDDESLEVDQKSYRSTIGNLLYLIDL